MIKLIAIPEENSEFKHHEIATESGEHFGFCWLNDNQSSWNAKGANKWQFNRGAIPIMFNWWPDEYYHDTLESLVRYMEENFPASPLPERED